MADDPQSRYRRTGGNNVFILPETHCERPSLPGHLHYLHCETVVSEAECTVMAGYH
jgi:hypothetical protein